MNIAINGFGRIGRGFLRAAYGRSEIEIVAINDLAPGENLAYLLKYDSVYGRAKFPVAAETGALIVDGKRIYLTQKKDPTELPWEDMKIDIVVESTGFFVDPQKAHAHISAGAKKVVITAPIKSDPSTGSTSSPQAGSGQATAKTILIGANEDQFGTCDISSNASCTTNAANPLIGILDEAIGIERALLNTTHAYTASQSLVDSIAPDDFRRGRAGAANLSPSSTGAAKATTLAYTQLAGKFDGIAVRVPVTAGSIVDITFVPKRATSVLEVNDALRAAAASDRWKRVFAITDEPLVSSDIVGQPYGAIADLAMTRVVEGTLVKVLAWYDNEMGYCHTLVEHVVEVAKRL